MFDLGLALRSRCVREIAVACALTLSVASSGPALAQSKVRILVNDEAITSHEIQSRAKMLALFSQGRQGEKQAIDQLIDERLMVQEAKRRNMLVSDAEVDAEFSSRAQKVKLTPEQFGQALSQNGVSPDTFKNFLRANLSWSGIVRSRFRATVKVTDLDVAAALTGKAGAESTASVYEYLVQPIIFLEASGSAEARAKAFRSNFKGCDQSLQQVSGMTGVVVKPTVRREQGQLPAALKEVFAAMQPGGISEPQPAEEGVQLLAICEKRAISGQSEATEEVREEISSERGQLMARRYLRDLKSDAVIEYR